MLKINYVSFKNFLSYGNSFTRVDFGGYQLTAITGANANGKTTIMNAVVFALYNRSINRINKNNLINNINQKDCVVEVGFTTLGNTYKVIRSIKPNNFEIYKNEQLITVDSKSKDYQKILEEQILGMDFKTFIQTVTISMVNYTPFMGLSNTDRRVVVEDLLGIRVLSSMNSILKGKISDNNAKLNEIKVAIQMIKSELESQKKTLDALKNDSASSEESFKEEIEKINSDIESRQKGLKTLYEELSTEEPLSLSLDDLNIRIDDFKGVIGELKARLKIHNTDVKFVKVNDTCPKCHQEISSEYRGKIIAENERAIKELNSQIAEKEKSLKELEKEKGETLRQLDSFSTIRGEISKEKGVIQTLEKHKKKLGEKLENSGKKGLVEEFEENFKKRALQAKQLGEEKKTLEVKNMIYRQAEKILSDDGVKSVILNQYIPIINRMVNHYLQEMNFYLSFELDNQFNETLRARGRDNMTYSNLSEGEKRRLDMAILFTWRDVAQRRNCCSCSNIFIDEILDSSLDSDGLESIIRLLKSFKESNILLISHRENVQDIEFDRVLTVSKPNQFSTIK